MNIMQIITQNFPRISQYVFFSNNIYLSNVCFEQTNSQILPDIDTQEINTAHYYSLEEPSIYFPIGD